MVSGTLVALAFGNCPALYKSYTLRRAFDGASNSKREKMKFLKPFLHQDDAYASGLYASESPLIYAVDDVPELTKLYTALLEASGYRVRTFNDRAEVVAALRMDRRKPELLITDCLGHSMPVERFMGHCLDVHPTLRVLMASSFNKTDAEIMRERPDRFIQKPFTPEEFQREVSAALAA